MGSPANTFWAVAIGLSLGLAGCAKRPRAVDETVRPVRIRQRPAAIGPAARTMDLPGGADVRSPTARSAGSLIGSWPRSQTRVDLDEQHTPVRTVLQKLARMAHLNFVVADEVRGEVTCAFDDVPWTEALVGVLRAAGLQAEREGNVVYVRPVSGR